MTQGWGRRAATLTVMIAVMASPAAAQRPYDEVVRDLKSTDPDTRVAALRVLGAASYPESMAPIASLLTDPLDAIQFETINTLLGFVLVDKVATKKRVALVVEVRDKTSAQAAFEFFRGAFSQHHHAALFKVWRQGSRHIRIRLGSAARGG